MKRIITFKIILLVILFIALSCLVSYMILNRDKLKEPNTKDPNIEETPKPNEPIIPEKDPFIAALENEKYYIPANLERYIAYNDGVKTTKQIVTDVNCNIDREFYTNTISTDLNKGNLILAA